MNPSDWQGAAGASWARDWQRTDRSFAALDPALLAAIGKVGGTAPRRIVDVGCGAGATSLAVADRYPGATLTGVDLSAGLLAVAADRVRGRPGVALRHGDAVALAAGLAPVDLFVSRHGVMFFADPVAAFAAFAGAGAPGARFVFSCFAEREANPWATRIAEAVGAVSSGGPGPFAFAEPQRVAAILSAAGWTADAPQRVPYPYVAGGGADPVADAVDFFTRIGPAAATLRQADGPHRATWLDRIAAVCHAHRDQGQVAFPATAWIWTARRQEERPA